jgi:hypothetical protein
MSRPSLVDRALAHAVEAHFCKLFEVLMHDPSPAGLKRFQAGLDRLIATEAAVKALLLDYPQQPPPDFIT